MDYNEFAVLRAINELRGNAYGVTIRQNVEKHSGRTVSIGAIYLVLSSLAARGMVSSCEGEATPERGNKRKQYWALLLPGREALDAEQAKWSTRDQSNAMQDIQKAFS